VLQRSLEGTSVPEHPSGRQLSLLPFEDHPIKTIAVIKNTTKAISHWSHFSWRDASMESGDSSRPTSSRSRFSEDERATRYPTTSSPDSESVREVRRPRPGADRDHRAPHSILGATMSSVHRPKGLRRGPDPWSVG
jgi:hypothetical protein